MEIGFLTQSRACWFCLAPDGARLRLDKRGNPFLSCCVCGTYAFLRTPSAFASLGVVQPFVTRASQAFHNAADELHADMRARSEMGRRELRAAISAGALLLSDEASAAVRSGAVPAAMQETMLTARTGT
mgnify:CR=1 FL=1